jgi:hypothetical protein
MIPQLNDLLAGIRTHSFVRPDYYAGLDCNDALDQRDAHVRFDSDWKHVHDATRPGWSEISPEICSQVDAIRKESFLMVSRATRQHEIASYVSDDFDLLCRCQVLGTDYPIIEHLWQAYQSGTFPLPAGYAPPNAS